MHSLNNCLCCTSKNLNLILDLGNHPLANNLKNSPEEDYHTYPLAINVCEECFHVQLTHAVDPEIMFKSYLYSSGTTNTLQKYFKWFSDFVIEQSDCKIKTVLDIGCNDGTQLDYFKQLGIATYGIDPAENQVEISKMKGHNVLCSFVDKNFISHWPKFSCIIAQNVFAHNSDPYQFLLKCSEMLEDDGVLYIQTSQADMILKNEFDTIYHEHISFFSINSMNILLNRTSKLYLCDVVKTPIHGNSYVFIIKKHPKNISKIQNFIDLEKASGLHSMDAYLKFAKNVNSIEQHLAEVIHSYVQKGYKLIGYGAAAKGITVLHTFNLGPEYIIDDNKLKQGKYTQIENIPITSIDRLSEEEDDEHLLFLPLAWNFSKEITERIQKVRPNSKDYDKFIYYFPTVTVQ